MELACMYICAPHVHLVVHGGQKRGSDPPGTKVTDVCEPWYGSSGGSDSAFSPFSPGLTPFIYFWDRAYAVCSQDCLWATSSPVSPSKCWDYRWVPLYPAKVLNFDQVPFFSRWSLMTMVLQPRSYCLWSHKDPFLFFLWRVTWFLVLLLGPFPAWS